MSDTASIVIFYETFYSIASPVGLALRQPNARCIATNTKMSYGYVLDNTNTEVTHNTKIEINRKIKKENSYLASV